MRVICIDVSNPKHPHLLQPEHYITEGENYTVTGEYLDTGDGHYYYYLAERQMKPLPSYRADRFVPLMNEDAEIEEEVIISFTTQPL